jgi:hypothetical protein
VVAVAVFVALLTLRDGGGTPVGRQVATAVTSDRAELEALSREVEQKRRVIEGLLRGERRKRLAERLARSDAYVEAALRAIEDRDRGAGAMLVYADELRRHGRDAPAAGREYRRVIELFPDSPLASVARANLDRVEQ